MNMFDIAAVLITLAALFSWINYRFLRLPQVIGLMVIAMVLSLLLVLAGITGLDIQRHARAMLVSIDFSQTLMHGMLSFLLFAGALHIDINDLAKQKAAVASLATIGIALSTLLVGCAAWLILEVLGLPLPFIYCLLFGALISPTDPIAVLAVLKTVKVAKSLEIKIAGESLFNDGVAVVLFVVLLHLATGSKSISPTGVLALFFIEAAGGALFGLLIGYITYRMIKGINSYQVEVLLTLALVMGGYALAVAMHISGPIAIVVAGLLIGNHGRSFAMSDKTREHLDSFWELLDEILNAVLFVLIGLEVLTLPLSKQYLLASLIIIPVVLAARFVSVGLPIGFMRRWRSFSPGAVQILTWGGLRGGISVALALSLPEGIERSIILTLTYVIVVFSIIVQGLTIEKLLKKKIAQAGYRQSDTGK